MIFERVVLVAGIERVPLRQSLGRTLAEDIAAPIDVPGRPHGADECQPSITFWPPAAAETSTFRGLACSATGILTTSTPLS